MCSNGALFTIDPEAVLKRTRKPGDGESRQEIIFILLQVLLRQVTVRTWVEGRVETHAEGRPG
jgi:hypothetical protein